MWNVVVAQVVAHPTTDREVLSLIPTVGWAFFFSLSLSGASLNRSLMEEQHNWFSPFQQKNEGLAVQLEAKRA